MVYIKLLRAPDELSTATAGLLRDDATWSETSRIGSQHAAVLSGHPDYNRSIVRARALFDIFTCLDPRTKQVVDILADGPVGPGCPQPRLLGSAEFVNSSLDQFIASVRAVTVRFPYDSEVTGKDCRGEEDEDTREERRFNEWAQVMLDLAETLGPIDPVPVGEFWQVFLSDVSQGLYASEARLDPPDG